MNYLKKFLIVFVLFVSGVSNAQSLEDLLRKVDSTKNAVMDRLQQGEAYEEKNLPDIIFEPEKILWKTMYLPYVKMKVPKSSRYDIEFRRGATLYFVAGGENAPYSAMVNVGVMSKEDFEEYTRDHLSDDCGACEKTELPAGKYPKFNGRNSKYIEYEGETGFLANPRYLSLTFLSDVNPDSVFWVSVRSRKSDNFRQTTRELFDYVLSNVEILDEYGPFQKQYKFDNEVLSRVVNMMNDLHFNKESETFMARQSDGDVFVAATADGNTYIHKFTKGNFNQPGSSIHLANLQIRDLIATDQGFAGLFIENVSDGKLIFLNHYNENGNQLFKTQLLEDAKTVNIGDMVVWDGYDCHKLATVGDRFVAYISVLMKWESGADIRSYSPNSMCSNSANGVHQSEALITLDSRGNIEYDDPPQNSTASTSSGGFSMSAGSSAGAQQQSNALMKQRDLKYGYWWGPSHSFTKNMIVKNDHVLKMTVNDAFPSIGLHGSLTDVDANKNFESEYYDPYTDNIYGRLENATSKNGYNYVDGLMAGNIHADAENVYVTYAKAEEPHGKTIYSQPAGGLYDANYHTKDVYFSGVNLTNSPDLLETNVKSIPLGEYYLVTWNVFPENAQAGQPQDQMVIVDHRGKTIITIADIPTRFFTDASAGRNSGYFRLHRYNPVYHGSDLVKLDEYTALWSRVLPGTGEVEFVTIQLPEELR